MRQRKVLPFYVWHTVEPEWTGETAFIVGGGPSVASQNIELLRGRRVIVVNSSYEAVPFADYLIYCDHEWWAAHRKALEGFGGKIINPTSSHHRCDRRLFVRKIYPPGLSSDRSALAVRRTTFTGAINLAVHLGAARIVLLGADGKMGADGKSHHHQPHRWWRFKAERWDLHRRELETLVEPLRKLGIDVVNASPGSAWDLWPVMTLDEAIERFAVKVAA